jgi:hypothetical protein
MSSGLFLNPEFPGFTDERLGRSCVEGTAKARVQKARESRACRVPGIYSA